MTKKIDKTENEEVEEDFDKSSELMSTLDKIHLERVQNFKSESEILRN